MHPALTEAKRRAEVELPGAIDARLKDVFGEGEVELSGQHLTMGLGPFGYAWLHSGRKD